MGGWKENELLQSSPLILLAIIPILTATCGIRIANLKSPINFQQGTMSCSPWRIGLSMSLISIPPFAFWCLLCPGPSSIFYLFGSLLSLFSVSMTVTKILHYIPSPSIFMYLKLRFQSESLQQLCALAQVGISLGVLFFYLMFTSSLLNVISRFPFYLMAPLVASLCLLSTVFAGQTMAMLPVFFVFLASLTAGCGIFVYYGLEEVTYFNEILSFQFSLQKSLTSLCVGFFLGFYQLAAGPTMYQIYFSLSTKHKLRICLSLYSAFSLFFSSFVFIIVSIFTHFMEKHCKLQYSAASLHEFIQFTVPRSPLLAFFVAVSLVLLLMFAYQWTFVALVSTLWEEFLKNRFKEWSTPQQLCVLQATALKVTIGLILIALLVGLSPVSYATYLPLSFYVILTLASLTTASFICGYFLPFTNYKGCFVSLAICSSLAVLTFWVNATRNPVPKLQNNCTSILLLNDGVESTSLQATSTLDIISRFPLDLLPITLILIFIGISVLISGITGWQDLFAIDWNLIVWPCCLSNSLSTNSYRKRRPFVESDSFRYAQNGDETANEKGIE